MAEKEGETWVEDSPATAIDVATPHKSKLEKRLLLKMDLSIVPLLACSFFIAYMVRQIHFPCENKLIIFKDRNNLGNARIMGMQADLHLSNEQFFNCLMMFCKFHHAKADIRWTSLIVVDASRRIHGLHAPSQPWNASHRSTTPARICSNLLRRLWDLPCCV